MELEDLKELLIKCWMTHDGMWFYHCQKECGMIKTNKINKAAIKSLASIEIKRIQRAFKIEKIRNFNDLKNLFDNAMGLFKADFMGFSYNFPERNHLHCEMQKCWAYDGIKKLGVIEQYECGIFDRIEGWFESLGIKYEVEPIIEGCLMYTDGQCFRDYFLFFDE
ncbi:MAG: DUF6125 family protein [Candidatus Hermodarchaeota archaeon]